LHHVDTCACASNVHLLINFLFVQCVDQKEHLLLLEEQSLSRKHNPFGAPKTSLSYHVFIDAMAVE